MAKPSIVFAHGLWADGSCFGKLIPTLQAEGHEVMASQHGLDSLATDVAAVKACLARVHGPTILVGHSYGGTLITHAGTDTRVAGLVYIAALAPDADETSQSLLGKFPTLSSAGSNLWTWRPRRAAPSVTKNMKIETRTMVMRTPCIRSGPSCA